MDIDIDLPDRTKLLKLIKNTPAMIYRKDEEVKHNTGVYVCDIPVNPFTGASSISYHEAEKLGYIKLDLLNVYVYEQVKDEDHLNRLVQTEPQWEKLEDYDFVKELIHIHGHWHQLRMCPEPVNSIPRLAMFISCIRPAKKHLIGKTWKEIGNTVWKKPDDGEYYFKKSHAIAYAQLVAVHMNLLSGVG